jgi:hypothetical protein
MEILNSLQQTTLSVRDANGASTININVCSIWAEINSSKKHEKFMVIATTTHR